MSSQRRLAWLTGIFFMLVLGLIAASQFWKDPLSPRAANERQLKEALQKQQLIENSLPMILPNAAPKAELVSGPPGKILPINLVWEDHIGQGGLVEQLGGCIAAGPGIDVFWNAGDLFVMKQKGRLKRVFSLNGANGSFGLLASICFDGKYVWAPLNEHRGFRRLIVLDPWTEETWELSAGQDGPRVDRSQPQRKTSILAIAPMAPGKVVALGWPGQPWLAMLTFDATAAVPVELPKEGVQDGIVIVINGLGGKTLKPKVEALRQPVDLPQRRSELIDPGSDRMEFGRMWSFVRKPARGGAEMRRIVLGRKPSAVTDSPIWSIEPEAARFKLIYGRSLAEALRTEEFADGATGIYWIEQAPNSNPQPVLVRAGLPDFKEEVVLTGIPHGWPVFYDERLCLLGKTCSLWSEGETKFNSVEAEVPWEAPSPRQPNLLPTAPVAPPTFAPPPTPPAPPMPGRHDVRRRLAHAHSSQHYGVLVDTYRVVGNQSLSHEPHQFYQFGLADDRRLKSEASPAAAPVDADLAAESPPGTIVSVLRLTAPESAAESAHATATLGPAVEPATVPDDVGLPILAREIVRQALLLAARDELGWSTRDAVLRETLPGDTTPVVARFALSARFPHAAPATFGLNRLDERGRLESLWKGELDLISEADAPLDYGKFAAAAERWSREAFPPLLRQSGLADVAPLASTDVEIPAGAESLLDQLTFTAQFAALAELHQAIRQQGASPALTGGLVRGYANLGALTEFHWTAVHKACKARSLLYAQRMAAARPKSAGALWHRAYAKALIGLHQSALDDLEAADEFAAASGEQGARPRWVDVIAAFCRFDDERLAASVESCPQLAELLQFLAVERLKDINPVQELVHKLLGRNRECFRVYDVLSRSNVLSTSELATATASEVLRETVPERLRQMDGLPPDAAGLLASKEPRATLFAELADALADALPDQDREELSWRFLGSLMQETQFVQFWRRTRLMYFQQSMPANEYVEAVAPLAGSHRYHSLLDRFLPTPQPQTAIELSERLDLTELDGVQLAEFKWALGDEWETRWTQQYLAAVQRPEQHLDDVYGDLLGGIDEDKIPAENSVARLRKLSPLSPDSAAAWILLRKPELAQQASAFERQFPGQVQVWRALIRAFPAPNEALDRRLRKVAELSGDFWTYQWVAAHYYFNKKFDEWQAVFDEFLAQPHDSLEADRVRVQLAEHFMKHKEWAKALPYAEQAAKSSEDWAVLCAARCYLGLGDVKNEGLCRARVAEIHPSTENSLSLYFWARRTGQDQAKSLQSQLDPAMDEMARRGFPGEQQSVGLFYQLSGRPKEAMIAYRKAAANPSEPQFLGIVLLRAAFAAQEIGEMQVRDEIFESLAAPKDPALERFQRLGVLIRQSFVRGAASADDRKAAEDILAQAEATQQPGLNYAIGRYLDLCGQTDEANVFFDKAAANIDGSLSFSQILASAALRDRGLAPTHDQPLHAKPAEKSPAKPTASPKPVGPPVK